MPSPMTAKQILDREFLEIRCKVLELAASFDRLQRSSGNVTDDPRFTRLLEALEVLHEVREDHAERVQLIFSRTYAIDWRDEFELNASSIAKPR